jgi:cytochrome c oxidase subunit 1
MNINYLVHNTLWVPGHFHLTVGTAVALTIMAGSYWLVPQVTGRRLYSRPIGLLQVVLWFVGMVFMSNAMHRAGLAGVPRRTAEPQYTGFDFSAAVGSIGELRFQIALGGVLLFVSTALFLFNVLLSGFERRVDTPVDDVLPEPLSGPEGSPRVLDSLALWAGIGLVLVALAYALPLASIVGESGWLGSSPGYPAVVAATLRDLLPAVVDAVAGLAGVSG